MITSKAANGYHLKTAQRRALGKKYQQMRLRMKREALIKLNRQANEQNLDTNISYDTARAN